MKLADFTSATSILDLISSGRIAETRVESLFSFVKKAYLFVSLLPELRKDIQEAANKSKSISLSDLEITKDELENTLRFSGDDLQKITNNLASGQSIILTLTKDKTADLLAKHAKQVEHVKQLLEIIARMSEKDFSTKTVE